ncbi:hypothetical protein Tco_1247837 [Tanacetum coccineum]
MKNPPLDQTKVRSEGDQARKSHQKKQLKRSPSLQVLPKVHPDLNQNHQASSQTPDREWNKTKTIDDRSPQSWMTQLAQASGTQSSFNEFLSTPIDFSAFIMNRLKLNNMTQDVLTGPTYDLMKGTCKSVVELEYHLEENARGRQVIPFDHFINNDLEYLKGGSLSQKYTTSITKTKAADYGHVKWIEDKGPKRQRFYGYTANMETSKDVYSRHMIIAITSFKIMEFFGYKHLEEITVRRQDDQLYRFALNVALRMYMRHILIQERVEDLQLAVESYQKKINLLRPDLYCSDLRKMTPYTSYHDIQGIIYQDDMDRNRLICTVELHKFSYGTLDHVRTALNDIATRIQMEYLPKRKWSKQDKQRARVMINAIDKKLRDRRLMHSLENFVGGRPYRGDLRLLLRTI